MDNSLFSDNRRSIPNLDDQIPIKHSTAKSHPSGHDKVVPPTSWKDENSHFLVALQDPWYLCVFRMQDSLYHATNDFFRHAEGFKYIFGPFTTSSVSSPMGLGSDSIPVSVVLHGQKTFLSDSMQFPLEYLLRVDSKTRGTYHVNVSSRGEDHDQMHLNQFFQIECETIGGLEDAIALAERYLLAISLNLLQQHNETLESIGGTSHISSLIAKLSSGSRKLNRITVREALNLPLIASNPEAWEYVANDAKNGQQLTRVGERILQKELGDGIWLTHMDHLSIPFYQAFESDFSHSTALCADLLLGPGEMIGLGQRHSTAEEVVQALGVHGLPEENYQWYIDMRNPVLGGKNIKTAGWGMGMERYLMWLLRHNDIRDIPIILRLKDMHFSP